MAEARRRLKSGESIFFDRCVLRVSRGSWPFADAHRDQVERYWSDALARNPHIFNGVIYPLLDHGIDDDGFYGDYARSDFASYLYWRENGFCDPPTCDGFASVMLVSSHGRYLMTKAAPYTLNAGLWVPAGGMVDQRDVDADGMIDVWRYGLRELAEETGLTDADLLRQPGLQIARDGALIVYGLFCRARETEEAIIQRFRDHNESLIETPELDEVKWFSAKEILAGDLVPRFVRLLLQASPVGVDR
ncbi:MAG: NUDIX hydrolase [Pseudomonadota bacterium]